MPRQKRKPDCEAADPKTQLQYNTIAAGGKEDFKEVRIYRARDRTGILAVVETEDGVCYIGYFSTVTRRYRRADLREPDEIGRISVKKANPDGRDFKEIQGRLNAYAQKHSLRELPLTIGGEI